ncbi:MAG: hypothetical protein IPF92_09620 [Myxococcales bacterium]|nr:hypothetical protein [Myxococcales bacterium]MBL0193001.1 hypothetical protein [Myxococcales bacterium]
MSKATVTRSAAWVGVLGFALCFAQPATASVTKSLDVREGFYFQAGSQSSVGCLRALKLDTTELEADIDTALPTSGAQVKCVAVLTDFEWSAAPADPMAIGGRVSVKNKQALTTLLAARKPHEVVMQFAIYEYDPMGKKYFLAVGSSGTDLHAVLDPQGATVDPTPAIDVSAPQNHAVTFSFKPKATPQTVTIGAAVGRTVAKPWRLGK